MRIAQKQTMRNRRKVLEAYCYGSHQVYNIADNEYRLHGRSLSLESWEESGKHDPALAAIISVYFVHKQPWVL